MIPIYNNGDPPGPKGIPKPMPTVNYLRIVGSDHVAAKGAERNEGYRKGYRSSTRLPINNELENKPPKITNSTSTGVSFGGA